MTENQPIHISNDDISQANQLSLQCPICGSAVEKNVDGDSLKPVVCIKCGTLYHKACWEQSGGKCAILGCGSTQYKIYGQDLGPVLKINYSDLPKPTAPVTGSYTPQEKRIKEDERRRQRAQQRWGFWSWFTDLLRRIKILE